MFGPFNDEMGSHFLHRYLSRAMVGSNHDTIIIVSSCQQSHRLLNDPVIFVSFLVSNHVDFMIL